MYIGFKLLQPTTIEQQNSALLYRPLPFCLRFEQNFVSTERLDGMQAIQVTKFTTLYKLKVQVIVHKIKGPFY